MAQNRFFALYGFWEGLLWCKILPSGVGTICPHFWEIWISTGNVYLFVLYHIIYYVRSNNWNPNSGFATWNSPGTQFGVLQPWIRLGSQVGVLRPGIRIPGRETYFKAAICLILASNTPPPPPHVSKFGFLRPGIRIPGRETKFKAAICLILASSTPPPPPHVPPPAWGGVGGVFEARIKKIAALK